MENVGWFYVEQGWGGTEQGCPRSLGTLGDTRERSAGERLEGFMLNRDGVR